VWTQTASVIGKDVPVALLQAIAELANSELNAALGRLQAGELLCEARIFPDLEYTFEHALTHDVAYGSLLQDRRRTLVSHTVQYGGGRLDQVRGDWVTTRRAGAANPHMVSLTPWSPRVTLSAGG